METEHKKSLQILNDLSIQEKNAIALAEAKGMELNQQQSLLDATLFKLKTNPMNQKVQKMQSKKDSPKRYESLIQGLFQEDSFAFK